MYYKFKDGDFTFWVAGYGSWSSKRIIFRVSVNSSLTDEIEAKALDPNWNWISPADENDVKAWLLMNPEFKILDKNLI